MFLGQDMYIRGFEGFHVVYDKSINIMPKILPNSTCALRRVVW